MGQTQTKEYYQTSIIPGTTVGYLSYLPPAYKASNEEFPLMIFLHGLGEIGSNLDDLLHYGPPMLIQYNKWPSDRPFIVVSPQSPSAFGGSWNPALVDEVIDQAVARYRVDRSRIYVTGTSLGGNGTWKYATEYPERVAAVVPICGWGTPSRACEMKDVPVWAFHNQGDNVVGVSGTINMIDALEKCGPNPWPKEVIYPESGHNAWSKTYDLSSGHDIYSWMLSFKKGTVSKPAPAPNKAPVANAGADKYLTLPTSSTVLSGTGSDADGNISSYAWTKTGGPAATMTNNNTKNLSLSKLVEGTYYFQLTVKDNQGATGTDVVQVIVKKQAEVPVNGQGLNYAYYEGNWSSVPNFSGISPKKTGTVANFSLANKSRADYYAFEFTGSIEILTAGTYTFYTSSDDGSKLYINSKEVVNNDGLHGLKEKSGAVYLSVGKHPISVGYFEAKGGDALNVLYSGPGVGKQAIPNARLYTSGATSAPAPAPAPVEGTTGLTYAYYEGAWSAIPNFSGLTPKEQGSVPNFNLNIRNSADNYAIEYQGYIEILTAGDYYFYTSSDDGSKLYISGKEIVNNDGLHGKKEVSGKIYLNAGKHPINVSYFEAKGDDILLVQYSGPRVSKQTIPNGRLSTGGSSSSSEVGKTSPTNPVNGLQYQYYEGSWSNIPNYSALTAKKNGTLKNFSLSPATAGSYYGFQFNGQIKINTAGDYTFYTSSDDGSKLYINGKEIVNNDGLHGKKEVSGRIALTAGYHDIRVTFFESKGDNILEVRYAGPGVGKQVIPDAVLFLPSSSTQSSTVDLKESSFAKASEAALESPIINESKAYPNPFSEEINVEIAADGYEGPIQISLLDLSGKVVYGKTVGAHETNGIISITTSNLNIATGMYFLQIIKGNQKEVFKMIKK